jgi:HEAT repeat protein
MNRPGFDECLQMIRSENHLIYSDGYEWIQDYLIEHVDDLLKLMLQEQNPDIRAKLVELLGDSENPKIIPFVEQELKHSEREVRWWAFLVLTHFGTPETTKIVEKFRQDNPYKDPFW